MLAFSHMKFYLFLFASKHSTVPWNRIFKIFIFLFKDAPVYEVIDQVPDDSILSTNMEGLNQFNSTAIEEVTPSAKLAVPDPKQINESLECDLVAEMQEKMNLRDEKLEKLFIEKIILKINNDFTGDSAAKKSAVIFLHDCFGDSIDDYNFIR